MAGCPEQDGLLFEERTTLTFLQDALDDISSLVGLVADGRDELRLCCGGALGPSFLVKRSLARPITPLAAARTVCVDR